MMRTAAAALCLVLLLALAVVVNGQPAVLPPLSPVQRCVNLGNMLEAPTEGDWGLVVEPNYLTTIAAAGFDTVRIPISWSTHAADQPPYTIDPAFFARIDEVIGWSLDAGLQAIINIHHYNEVMTDPAAHRDRLTALWTQIAARYADYPPTLLFELLNEPREALTQSIWNEYTAGLIATIRQTNPTRTLIVGGALWNSLMGLSMLNLPPDPHLIATFHYYSPFEFTHQGAEWSPETVNLSGIDWGTADDQLQVAGDLGLAAAWAAQRRLPLLLGEFGVYWRADEAARLRWTGFVREQADQLAIGWCYWEFAAGFGLYDRDQQAFNALYFDALMPGAAG